MSLRNYLNKIKPQFEEGGKLHSFKSLYDGFDTFLYVPNTTSKSGVNIHDAIDSKRIMSIVVIALIPALLFGMYNVGYQHYLHAGISGSFIEMFGYKCTLQTDTEVITYIMDYLLRIQGLTLDEAASVIAAPFWSTIAAKTDLEDQKKHTYLRTMFPSLLVTGPFSIVLGFNGGLMALNDRLKLRSMVVGEKNDKVFIASEEAAIRTMEPDVEQIWSPAGGEPVIVKVKEGAF